MRFGRFASDGSEGNWQISAPALGELIRRGYVKPGAGGRSSTTISYLKRGSSGRSKRGYSQSGQEARRFDCCRLLWLSAGVHSGNTVENQRPISAEQEGPISCKFLIPTEVSHSRRSSLRGRGRAPILRRGQAGRAHPRLLLWLRHHCPRCDAAEPPGWRSPPVHLGDQQRGRCRRTGSAAQAGPAPRRCRMGEVGHLRLHHQATGRGGDHRQDPGRRADRGRLQVH